MMSHIVVIGAGTGGMSGVYEIRDALSKSEHQVTLINEREGFQFVPSNPWLGVGWRKRAQISMPIKECVNKKGINFIAGRVTEIIAHKNQLKINNSEVLDYDYLVITTGPELAFNQIEGAGPDGFTQSVCSLDHAEASYQNVKELIENPGSVVVGAFQGASCFGPAYEYAFILEKALRDAKVRDRVPMTFVTCENLTSAT
jgi:sulfide:quinone oxidoreductase